MCAGKFGRETEESESSYRVRCDACLWEHGTQSVHRIAHQTGLSKSSVHRLQQAIARRGRHPESWLWEIEDGRGCPAWIYANRRFVENLWARLKEWRAVATRYEKTARSFLGIL